MITCSTVTIETDQDHLKGEILEDMQEGIQVDFKIVVIFLIPETDIRLQEDLVIHLMRKNFTPKGVLTHFIGMYLMAELPLMGVIACEGPSWITMYVCIHVCLSHGML